VAIEVDARLRHDDHGECEKKERDEHLATHDESSFERDINADAVTGPLLSMTRGRGGAVQRVVRARNEALRSAVLSADPEGYSEADCVKMRVLLTGAH